MNNELISIIIPVYNVEKYIRKCLDSVLDQTYTNWECILVDDGSPDNTGKICDEYADKDKRFKVIHKENEGVSIARNVGLDRVYGEWITFVDSDDYLLGNALEILYGNIVRTGADCLLAGSKVQNNDSIRDYVIPSPCNDKDVLKGILQNALWSYIFRASIIQENNIRFIPNLAYSEDQVFLCMFALNAKKITHIDTPVYVYRKNDASACASKDGLRKAQHQFEAAHQIMQYMCEHDCTKYQQNLLKRRAKEILKLGYYAYASRSFSFDTYREYEQSYHKYFPNRICLFFYTVWAYLTCQRRKIITFRK